MKLLLLLASVFFSVASGSVLGIDFGADSMKVGIISPGTSLDIVTNIQSKRKTPMCISFNNGERLFGSDSYAIMPRKPQSTFSKLYRTIGVSSLHPRITELKNQHFPYEYYTNETFGGTCVTHEDTFYQPEELLAMMMEYAKQMTVLAKGRAIRDCVISVPAYFTQHEKNALYAAAEIADLNILSLIEENTAAALNYGMDRVFDKPHVVLFYNMGTSSVQATVANFSAYEDKGNKTIGQFEIIGKGWDEYLGGFYFDLKVADMLAVRFNEVWAKKKVKPGAENEVRDVRLHPRPMARLRLEAVKIREVLSANPEFPVKIDELHAGVDFATRITRAEMEAECLELFTRMLVPIERALADAGITLDDVDSVQILGGGVRMPKAKQVLSDFLKASDLELGQNQNGDEAFALGAAFRAANLSTAFRVRKVGMIDHSNFGVSVHLEELPASASSGFFGSMFSSLIGGAKGSDVTDNNSEKWVKSSALYPKRSVLGGKIKTVAFQHDKDILCRLEYDTTDGVSFLPSGTSSLIAVYNITGVAEFAQETAALGHPPQQPRIHLSFSLDASGVVALSKAEATYELPVVVEEEKSPVNNLAEDEESGSADADASDSPASENESSESTTSESTTSESTASSTSTAGEAEDAPKKESKKKSSKKKGPTAAAAKKDPVLRRALTVTSNLDVLSPAGWAPKRLAESKRKLRALNKVDDERKAKEAALNDAEAYLYRIRNKFTDDEEALSVVSTSEQRQEAIDMANALEDWMYDEGRSAGIEDFKTKHAELKTVAEAVLQRFNEHSARPDAVDKGRKVLTKVRAKIESWASSKPFITDEEKGKLIELIEKAESWIDEQVIAQSAKSAFEAPAFLSSEVATRLKPVNVMFDKLNKKPAPVVKKANITETVVNATADGESSTAESSSEGDSSSNNDEFSSSETEKEGESSQEGEEQFKPISDDEL